MENSNLRVVSWDQDCNIPFHDFEHRQSPCDLGSITSFLMICAKPLCFMSVLSHCSPNKLHKNHEKLKEQEKEW